MAEKKRAFLFLMSIILILVFPIISASSNKTEAEQCLQTSNQIMQELSDKEFNVQRINDTIKIAQEIFNAQFLKESKNKSDYSLVFSYCQEIENIKESAYKAQDELYSFEKDYAAFQVKMQKFSSETSLSAGISEVDSMIQDIRQEMKDERYEKVSEKIPEIEKKMIEVEASATTLNLFYSTISRGLKEFLIENYVSLLVFVFLLLGFFIFYRLKLRKHVLMRKIKSLETEKKVIQEMTKKLQREYFETGKVSEGDYRIRTKKFAEMIRDIERQIPLLKEELAKMNAKINKGKKY